MCEDSWTTPLRTRDLLFKNSNHHPGSSSSQILLICMNLSSLLALLLVQTLAGWPHYTFIAILPISESCSECDDGGMLLTVQVFFGWLDLSRSKLKNVENGGKRFFYAFWNVTSHSYNTPNKCVRVSLSGVPGRTSRWNPEGQTGRGEVNWVFPEGGFRGSGRTTLLHAWIYVEGSANANERWLPVQLPEKGEPGRNENKWLQFSFGL